MSETNGMVTKLDKPRFFNRISLEVRMPRPNKNQDLLVLVYILFPAWKMKDFGKLLPVSEDLVPNPYERFSKAILSTCV